MMRKFTSKLIYILLIIAIIQMTIVSSSAETILSGQLKDLTWTYDSNFTLTLKGNVKIDDSYNEHNFSELDSSPNWH